MKSKSRQSNQKNLDLNLSLQSKSKYRNLKASKNKIKHPQGFVFDGNRRDSRLPRYNALEDKSLKKYYQQPVVQKSCIKNKLITKQGKQVQHKKFSQKQIKKTFVGKMYMSQQRKRKSPMKPVSKNTLNQFIKKKTEFLKNN